MDVLKDTTMYEAFEAAIRGGLAFVNKHHSEHKEGEKDLLYVDVNNLYGWALSQPLPYADFTWVYDQQQLNTLIRALPHVDCVNSKFVFFFEVDLEIPREFHDRLQQLPPAAEHMIPPPQLYGEQQNVPNTCKKLVTSLLPKKNYFVHCRLLKFYMTLGVRVTRIHRAVKCLQAPIFKDYIDYNTEKRKQSDNAFNKNMYKLKNNSLYGKTCENVRKRINLKLCNNPDKFVKFTSKVTFRKTIEITEDLVIALLRKGKIYLDKPIYVGQAVLDLSKYIMYDLYYNKLKAYERRFDCSINILGGDTDSFFLECCNVSLRNQLLPAMKEDLLLDTSNYPRDDPLYDDSIACKIGCIKDEAAGSTFEEFILLQPKMYSMKMLGQPVDASLRRAKGVNRDIVNTALSHDDYKRIYEDIYTFYVDEDVEQEGPSIVKRQRRFASIRHQVVTMESKKVALRCRDNKRQWIVPNESLPFGHYLLNNM
jgi:hypothetical protein